MKIAFRKNWLGRLALLTVILVSGLFLISAQRSQEEFQPFPQGQADPDSCTSIQVGRLASVDGSVMTAHTCDGNYRMWLNIVPHAKYPAGSKTKVYSGKMHTETSTDMNRVIQTGEIPQVAETFAFMNTAYPCMNEAGLAIGETTFGGRRELYNQEGMFMIEEIERLMLERCKTAREAIKLAGELIKQYGYGDGGECITIADAKEVWHCEYMGAGPLEKGGVWAAVRIPDDQIGISANIPRISEINLKDPDHYMASDNIYKIAQDMGWWDPKSGELFKFWKVYGLDPKSGRKPYSIREFYVFNTLAPSLKLTMDLPELPFSVKPDKKVSVRDILKMYRETYAGTEYDMTKNLMVPRRQMGRPGAAPAEGAAPPPPEMVKSPLAQPWMSGELIQLLQTIKPGIVPMFRPIAISGCSYATVIQCRSWLPPAVGTVCWFAFDNAGLSARIPIFAGVTELPSSFEICAQHRFRMDSAAWAFRRANRLATIKWGSTQKIMEDTVREYEELAFAELPQVEKKYLELLNSKTPDTEPFKPNAYLTKYTNDFARSAINKYQELGDKFWMFLRGGL
jgi:dipeptidase